MSVMCTLRIKTYELGWILLIVVSWDIIPIYDCNTGDSIILVYIWMDIRYTDICGMITYHRINSH